jgi:hypothetical protein
VPYRGDISVNALTSKGYKPAMPSQRQSRGSLQSQGVPIPSRLRGPVPTNNVGQPIQTRARQTSSQRSRRTPTRPSNTNVRARTNVRDFSPTRAADNVTGGSVGILEAEFITAIVLLVLLMFTNTASEYGDKIMSTMKRGTLICALFFVLALISSIGPTASKISKAFGALVVVSILVTSPTSQILTALDNLIKNDWIGTDETGNDVSADAGSSASPSTTFSELPANIQKEIEGAPVFTSVSGIPAGISTTVKGVQDAIKAIGSINSKFLQDLGL